MKHFSLYSIITMALMLAGSPVMGNPHALQAEPRLSTQIQWDLSPNGLLTLSYDLDHKGPGACRCLGIREHAYSGGQSLGRSSRHDLAR